MLDKLDIPFVVDKRLVRGLDYYARTTFEIQTTSLGAQSAVAGGGRYDGLVKELGGPDIPATGFAIGFDRLTEVSGLTAAEFYREPDIFIAALGEKSSNMAFEWVCALGIEGVRAEMDYSNKSLKAQMKRANRFGVPYVMIVGDDELKQGSAILRNMQTKEQESIPFDDVVEKVKAVVR